MYVVATAVVAFRGRNFSLERNNNKKCMNNLDGSPAFGMVFAKSGMEVVVGEVLCVVAV
jgi:hypothetical protein